MSCVQLSSHHQVRKDTRWEDAFYDSYINENSSITVQNIKSNKIITLLHTHVIFWTKGRPTVWVMVATVWVMVVHDMAGDCSKITFTTVLMVTIHALQCC